MTSLRYAGLVPALLFLAAAASASGPPKGDYTGQYRGTPVVLRLGPGATFQMTGLGNALLVRGTYTATRQRLAFVDVAGPIADKGAGTGKYWWRLGADKLTLRMIADALKGRAECLTGTPWTRDRSHHEMAHVHGAGPERVRP